MIKLENFEVVGWEAAIRGMRNPKNSWHRSDSAFTESAYVDSLNENNEVEQLPVRFDALEIGPNDHTLMMALAKGGPVHAKYRRMIHVYVDVTAPLYWWKEFDTYKVGTVANSCSTMHKIHSKPFEVSDFSVEDLGIDVLAEWNDGDEVHLNLWEEKFKDIVWHLELLRNRYNNEPNPELKKKFWRALIQYLPSSYNQKRTVDISYETLANIYEWRRNHKLDEWREVCKWIESLPYSEIITQPILEKNKKVDVEEIFALIEKVKEDNPYIKTELLSEFEDRLRKKVK